MNKQELLSAYTAEQLAEMVEKYQKSFDAFRFSDTFLKAGLFDNPASAAYEAEIRGKEKKIEELERQLKEMDKISVVVGGITKTYQIEEIGDIVRAYEEIKHCKEHDGDHLHSEEYLKIISLNREVAKLQSLVGKYRKSFEDAKKERDCQIAEYQNRVDTNKAELERAKNIINQIDDILEELFGVKHDAVEYGEFEQFLREKVMEKVPDFLPAEPIKVADTLIDNAMKSYNSYVDDFAKAYSGQLVIGNLCEDVRRQTFSHLRQIAEHLLVYCNANGEME